MVKQKNWIRRHWIWSIVIGFVLLIFLISVFSNDSAEEFSHKSQERVNEVAKNTIAEQKEIDIEIIDLKCEIGKYGWTYITGRVENKGTKTARFVKLSIDLFNEDEWVISDFTYVRNTDIPTGGIDSFRNTFLEPITWTRCEAFVTGRI